jgi:HEAT repeat protein
VLLDGLDHPDDLVRESFFEAFFRVTGTHMSYEPLAPRDERLETLAKLRGWWAEKGGPDCLIQPFHVPWAQRNEAVKLIEAMGGGDGLTPAGDDAEIFARLVELEDAAVEVLAHVALKYPPGFAQKRAMACNVLGALRKPAAVPALVATLRDPVVSVAAWACDALARIGDREALPAVQRWHQRLLSLASRNAIPETAGAPDLLVAQAAGARLALGDERSVPDLVALLLSPNADARRVAIEWLRVRFGEEIQYDPDAAEAVRRAAVEAWQGSR